MARLITTILAVLLVGLAATGVPALARAQTTADTTGTITSGSIPPDGGFGIVVYGGGTFNQLVIASGCPAANVGFWFTVAGNFVVYLPGTSVGAANAGAATAFPQSVIPANTALIGRCVSVAPNGIQGRVSRGPICPVQRVGDPTCNDQPYQATIMVYSTLVACPAFTCGEVASTTSGADGTYSVTVSPGTYNVVAQNIAVTSGGFPRAPAPVVVTVQAGQFTTVNFSFDTGIR